MKTETPPTAPARLLGAHLSIAGGLHNAMHSARSLGCTAAQIFTKNASTWRERSLTAAEIERFSRARTEARVVAVASHTSYLINPAAPDDVKQERSQHALQEELRRAAALGLEAVVLHPGAHMGAGTRQGLQRAAACLNAVFAATPAAEVRLLLETTAGQGTCLGHRFEELADILEHIDDPRRVGVCFDTCHVFAAGYDLRSEAAYAACMDRFDRLVGIELLRLIHLNDAKTPLGSRVDRHAHIGAGTIGLATFGLIMNDPRLTHIPKILETPKDQDGDRKNLACLRKLVTS